MKFIPLLVVLPFPLIAGTSPQFSLISAPGSGASPHVKRFDFGAPQVSFYPFASTADLTEPPRNFQGMPLAESGIHFAVHDLDHDGISELVTSTTSLGAGAGPHVRFFKFPSAGGTGQLTTPYGSFDPSMQITGEKQRFTCVGTYADMTSRIITGAGAGGGPHVRIFSTGGGVIGSFLPYGDGYNAGIRVAAGDVNGDGVDEIVTSPGPGGGQIVKVFDGVTFSETFSFSPYGFVLGGINVAAGDLDGDGRAEIVTGIGPGAGPHVKIYEGASFVAGAAPVQTSYFPFGGLFSEGVRVAVGDVDGDGRGDVFAAGTSQGRRRVEVLKSNRTGDPYTNREVWTWTGGAAVPGDQFEIAVGDLDGDGRAEIVTNGEVTGVPRVVVVAPRTALTFDTVFNGGISVASGDVNGDGKADIITGAAAGGGPNVRVFDGISGQEVRSFFAFDTAFTGGISVASGDVTGDGVDDIITGAGAGAGPHVKVFDGLTGNLARSFFAFEVTFQGGVSVGAGDLDGDGSAEIIVGAGPGGGPHVKVFNGANGAVDKNFFAFDPSYQGGVHVAAGARIAGLLLPAVQKRVAVSRIVGGGPGGGPHVKVFNGMTGAELAALSPFGSDFGGEIRIAIGDLDGDGMEEVIAGASPALVGPTVIGMDVAGQVELKFQLPASIAREVGSPSAAAPSVALTSRPLPSLIMNAPEKVAQGFRFTARGTPGTWLNFEKSTDLVNWLPVSSTYIPNIQNNLATQILPIVEPKNFVRAAAR